MSLIGLFNAVPGNRGWLFASVALCLIPFWFSRRGRLKPEQEIQSFSSELAFYSAVTELARFPDAAHAFHKVVVGLNVNVDIVVSATELMNLIKSGSTEIKDHDVIQSLTDLEETFMFYFRDGAPTERYVANLDVFRQLLGEVDTLRERTEKIGGNAALLAEKMASMSNMEVLLVGPIGPRARHLISSKIHLSNSTRIPRDQLHVILEYKRAQICGDEVAPTSSRFIVSHDKFSSSRIVLDVFFHAVANSKPDLVVLAGLHLFQSQPDKVWAEKLRQMKENLALIPLVKPVHLEVRWLTNHDFALAFLEKVLPLVDSIGVNEQDLVLLSAVKDGPYSSRFPVKGGAISVYKTVEIIDWLLKLSSNSNSTRYSSLLLDEPEADESANNSFEQQPPLAASSRLQRVHFQCSSYQLIALKAAAPQSQQRMSQSHWQWSNQEAALAAAVKEAGVAACRQTVSDHLLAFDLPLGGGDQWLLDKTERIFYSLQTHQPVKTWFRRDGIRFLFSPALVCRDPPATRGVPDAVSAAGLLFSKFIPLAPPH